MTAIPLNASASGSSRGPWINFARRNRRDNPVTACGLGRGFEGEDSLSGPESPHSPLAPAEAVANTGSLTNPGVSTRCKGRRKKVVQTRRYPRGGASSFNLPYRVRQ